MLKVKTYIDKSDIAGIGLFADEDIEKGTLVWDFVEGFDLIFTKDDIKKLDEIELKQFNNYSYFDKFLDKYIMCFDDARFFNHADDYNVDSPEGHKCFANRFIKKGEELTCNYNEFDKSVKDKLKNYED
jgi:SET domain-containing protein